MELRPEEGRPESPDHAARDERRTNSHAPARRHFRWRLWVALGLGVLVAGWLLPREGSPRGATHGSSELVASSLFGSLQQLIGLGGPSARSRQGAAGDEPLASVNALRAPNAPTSSGLDDNASTGAPPGEGAEGAPLAAGITGATIGAAPAAGVPVGDDTPRDARVTGRVLDATGGPIGGAVVRVHFDGAAFERARQSGRFLVTPAPGAEWISDAEGRFEGLAPSGGVSLVASADAYVEARKRARAPAHDIVIVLAPAARVSGRVQRGDGTPVSGASLELRPRAFHNAPVEGTSDERGEFSIGGVPAGVIEVTASAAGLSAAHEWLHLSLAEVSPPVVLTLTEAHSVYGVVREPGGSPCTSGMVHAGGRWQRRGDIDAEGHYRLDGLDPGTHELSATCFNAGAQTRTLRVGADSPPSIQLDWQLDAGFAVSGSVRRKNGEPVAGAMVWPYGVAPPDGSGAEPPAILSPAGTSCNTDAAGEFRCDGLRAGWYRVNAGSPAGASASSDPVRAGAESEPHVALVLPDSGEVRVRVAGAATSGDGFNGLFARGVFARGEGPFPIPAHQRGDQFVFEGMALGRYRVAVGRAPSELGPSAVDIELTQPGQVIELELRAPDPLAIAGIVVDAAGEPLPDAWVDASIVEPGALMPFSFAEPVLTSSEGSFLIADLPPGRYALRASHPSGEGEAVDVGAGQTGVRLVVQGHGSLSGTVTTADGQLARDFNVLAFREKLGRPLSVDGEQGSWELPWLTPGNYQVVVMSPTGGVATHAQVASGKETKLTLRLDPELAGQAVSRALQPSRKESSTSRESGVEK